MACQRLGRTADEAMLQDGNRSLENRLRLAVEILNEAKILLVLDNLESLLPLPPAAPVWEWPDIRAFFSALLSRLTGQGRAILTCRYLPNGFDPAQQLNLAHEAMPDFTEADFFKYLRRHPRVADRMDRGELSRDLIETFHRKLGATPRFVEQASVILATLDADRLAEQLDSLATPAEGTAGDDLWQLQQAYFRDLFLPQLFETLSPPHRVALSRLALVGEALPPDGVARVAALEPGNEEAFTRRCTALSLLQRFGEENEAQLFAVYPLQREFFTAAERLPEADRRGAHLAAAGFFRECYEKDREEELGLSIMAELLACLHHAAGAGDFALQVWAAVKLARRQIQRAEYASALSLAGPLLAEHRHPDLLQIAARCASATGDWPQARQLAEEEQRERQVIGDRAGEAATWHQLATIDLNEGNYGAAREKFGKSLAIKQAIGDRAGEAATWHNLASIDMNEGNYGAAREKFGKALAMLQAIGDRAGEAGTWHQLASIDMYEGNYGAAREKFGKSLAMRQAIGDRAGEAATWHQLATIDLNEGDYGAAREKFGKALAMRQAIGARGGEASTWHQLATIDLNEGNYGAAREKFGKSLAIKQAIGDRAGEAATLAQIALYAWERQKREPAVRLMAMSFQLLRAINSANQKVVGRNLDGIASALKLDQAGFDNLLRESAEAYQRDRGAELVRQAFEGL
jgi:tetratricopeptide (TPR) repeat protein